MLPFLFPALALGAAVTLARAGRPAWQAEAAGLIGQGALIAALAILQETLNVADTSAYGALCGLIGVARCCCATGLIGSVRMTGWGLSVAILALRQLRRRCRRRRRLGHVQPGRACCCPGEWRQP